MDVVLVASEVAPFSKTGGLGDAVAALARELARTGHRVWTVSPRYRGAAPDAVSTGRTFRTPLGGSEHTAGLHLLSRDGVAHLFVDNVMYDRDGLYGDQGGSYGDNHLRFALLCQAALHAARWFTSDEVVFHLHDWQGALAPIYLKAAWYPVGLLERAATVLTLHNPAHQGRCSAALFADLELPPRWMTPWGLEFYGDVGLLKGGILHADEVTTVSPTFAREIVTPGGGFGLERVLAARPLTGILNGIDTDEWNPEIDPHIAARFSATDPSPKAVCKAALQAELGLPIDGDVPLFGWVGRLDPQKGVALLLESLPWLVGTEGAQIVVLGSAASVHRGFEERLRELEGTHPHHLRAWIGYNEAVAHRIVAGTDLFLMPSVFEPCGLTQMYAQRYGSVPIVRRTGGLADSVTPIDVEQDTGTGLFFELPTGEALRDALWRGLALYRETPEAFARAARRGMEQDFSWGHAVGAYVTVYLRALARHMPGEAIDGPDFAVEDLREVVTVGLARGAALLSAGELVVARAILGLGGDAARVYARLSARVPTAFVLRTTFVPDVSDLGAAVDQLAMLGLADRLVPPTERARRAPAEVLRDACRAAGLPTSGRRAELIARLPHGLPTGADAWFRLTGRALVARLARFAFQQAWPDRARPLLARLGIVRWPTYALTTGRGLFRHRAALLAWEALLGSSLTPEYALDAVIAGVASAPGGLDLERTLRAAVRDAAERAERGGEPGRAAALYARLVDAGERPGRVAFRHARAEEALEHPNRALAVLRGALPQCLPSEVAAIVRAGRRLARQLRTSFPPAPPLHAPIVRDLRLRPDAPSHRPRWATPDGPRTIEAAIVAWLAGHGRIALHGEGGLFSTMCALLLADLYFLPVPGALPVRYLAGPLDLGTPAFRTSRPEAWAELVADVEAGRAAARLTAADDRWRGTRLTGARWDVAGRELMVKAVEGLGAPPLLALLVRFADAGPRSMAGLPDLVVCPGPAVRLPDAFPSQLPEGLLLAEVKGPGDTLRDAQVVWIDHLLARGATVEVWKVEREPLGRSGPTASPSAVRTSSRAERQEPTAKS